MPTEFGKIFAFLLIAIIFVIVSVFMAKLIRPARLTKEKLMIYECGENPEGTPESETKKGLDFSNLMIRINIGTRTLNT